MKRISLLLVGLIAGSALLAGCAAMHTWPEQERSAESKMVVIQENIGDGLKTGTLTPDQAQMFLTTLKGIRTDFTELRDKVVYREEWDNLHRRLDALGQEINRAQSRTPMVDEPRNGERIVALQDKIDNGRSSRRWSSADEREFQARLDSIRRDYFRMTEGGRATAYDERADIARRLDALEADINRYR